MRYRALDADGDYIFGVGVSAFLVDSPEAVAQAVKTRLSLKQGEWFLDLTAGTPYSTQILGENTRNTYDFAIQQRVLQTPGVKAITQYHSEFDPYSRAVRVTLTIDTIYGQAILNQVL